MSKQQKNILTILIWCGLMAVSMGSMWLNLEQKAEMQRLNRQIRILEMKQAVHTLHCLGESNKVQTNYR